MSGRREEDELLDLCDGEEGEVVTTSRVKAWWLASFCGHTLKCVKRVPKLSPFGSLYYRTLWLLHRPGENDENK